ncbi:hypothetical protein TNCT_129691 [Trichonephila clavata]|uniref:Uncharacterized protein n=1 Tax=Trichonephila clavata TaxID=2740835 RepID=A0A8X6KE43_TRICU|nr:hypothetical protein TNCT_129691 [Trichonephila clavata]
MRPALANCPAKNDHVQSIISQKIFYREWNNYCFVLPLTAAVVLSMLMLENVDEEERHQQYLIKGRKK